MALIAIYDSGVGGLSIYQNVIAQCPQHDYLFISDNQAFPYGNKSADELLGRVQAVVRTLNTHFSIDILIVACNTASTIVLPHLRREFSFHIIGVVPAIKPAAELSATHRIALLATPATIDRDYTKSLINKFAPHCQVTCIGSSELVLLAEQKLTQGTVDENKIEAILEPVLSNPEIDVLVLACTHFPLLKAEIESIFERRQREVTVVDSGAAIANRVSSLIQLHSLTTSERLNRIAILTEENSDIDYSAQQGRLGFKDLQYLVV
jgi:glutamate racemase